jgi:hypothetical protein
LAPGHELTYPRAIDVGRYIPGHETSYPVARLVRNRLLPPQKVAALKNLQKKNFNLGEVCKVAESVYREMNYLIRFNDNNSFCFPIGKTSAAAVSRLVRAPSLRPNQSAGRAAVHKRRKEEAESVGMFFGLF